jgi:hypothetical protein
MNANLQNLSTEIIGIFEEERRVRKVKRQRRRKIQVSTNHTNKPTNQPTNQRWVCDLTHTKFFTHLPPSQCSGRFKIFLNRIHFNTASLLASS